MEAPSWIAAALAPLAGWTGYLQRRVDNVIGEQAKDRERIAGMEAKLDGIHTLVKEIREDQKRREREPFQDSR